MVNSDVILSPLTVEDLGFLLEVRNDYSTRINLENDSIFSLDECRNWFKKLMNPWYLITAGENKVGYFRTNGTDIGCDIHPAHRRKGYARSSYLEYLKDKNYATLWVFEDNFAKILYEEIGFLQTKEFKIVRNRKYLKMIYER
jgi:ribosomal protein S18 acetylase RimI-like enzyme